MKVLLVEDDKIIWKNIKEFLQEYNFIVDREKTWEDWERKILNNNYDIVLLDVMLPNKNWFEVAEKIKLLKIKIPIIFLTAKWDIESKEKWFLVWGMDYIVKPFALKELLLRINSILKREKKVDIETKLKYEDIEININTMEVKRWNKKIELTKKEYQILEFLLKNKWRIVSKQEILWYIRWINNDIWSDVVRTHIQSLRKKLNKGFDVDYIKTIRWFWFKMW